MNIGEKQGDFAAGAKEVGELDLSKIFSRRPSSICKAYHGHKVGAVGSVMSESGLL